MRLAGRRLGSRGLGRVASVEAIGAGTGPSHPRPFASRGGHDRRRRRLPLLPTPEPGRRDRLATLGRDGLRRGAASRPPRAPLPLGGVVPLVPRDGRDELLRPARHRARQPGLRAGACGQRPRPRREPPLQHGRLADDRLPHRQWGGADRRDVPPPRPDGRGPRQGARLLRRAPRGVRRARRAARGGAGACGRRRPGSRRPGARGRRRGDRFRRRPGGSRRPRRPGRARHRPRLRPAARRARRRAQVPAGRGLRLPPRLRRPARRRRVAAAGPLAARRGAARDAHAHGRRRRLRPSRGRVLPLRDAARLGGAPLREDARGQRPPGAALPRSVAGDARWRRGARQQAPPGGAPAYGRRRDRLPPGDTVARRSTRFQRQLRTPTSTTTRSTPRDGGHSRLRSSTRPSTSTGTRSPHGRCSAARPCSAGPS